MDSLWAGHCDHDHPLASAPLIHRGTEFAFNLDNIPCDQMDVADWVGTRMMMRRRHLRCIVLAAGRVLLYPGQVYNIVEFIII